MAPPSHQHHVNMHTSSNALYQGPLSPNSIPQNLTKSQTQAEVSASHTKSDLAQKIALLPLGNSGTDFLPVRWGHLAANLPNLAARLASPRGDNSSPQPLILNTSTAGLLRKHLGETEFLSSNQFEHYSENYLGNKELSQSLDIHDMGNEARTSDKDIFNNPSVSEYAYSLMSSSVQENTNIPVYKSKLEKAIAQNQLSKLKAETQSQLSHLVKSSAKESIDSTNALENVLTASSGISGSLLFKKYSDSASRLNDFPNVNEPTESIQTQIQQMPLSSITRNIEIKQIKKPALMKKQLAIQPKPPSNPLVAPVVEPAETYHILRSEPPAAASEPEPVYLYVTRPDVPKEQPPPIITEKKYNDYGLASDILKNLWKLREEGKYCDAVLFCGKNFVRAHRLVLLASSPELQKKSADCSESELKLVLPEGIQEESVEAFLAFLYNGNITLTVDNVQQIYRIALIFSIDAVVRYCYDFCKEAKLGHLIISVPYLETAVHVHLDRVRMDETNLVAKRKLDAAKKKSRMQTVDNLKSPVKQEVMSKTNDSNKGSANIDTISEKSSQVTNQRNETSGIQSLGHADTNEALSDSPNAVQKITDVHTSVNDKTSTQFYSDGNILKEMNSSDIDWHTNDPSQSNIPIRKRGRNRKVGQGVPTSLETATVMEETNNTFAKHVETASSNNITVNNADTSIANLEYDVPLVDKMIVDGDLNQSLGMKSKDQMGNERVEGNMKQRLKKDYTLRRRKDKSSDKQDISKVSATFKPIADTQANNDTIEGVGKELSHNFTLFPDPLVTGKLDEDELRKSDNLCEVIEERTVATDNETTVSRFRKRPSNISLLEAAEQKKAKSNDTSALFITSTSSSKKPKAKGRKSPKSKPGTSVNQVQAHNPDDLAALNKNLQQKVQSDHGIEMIVDPVESYSKSLDGLKDYEGVGQNKVVSTIDGTHLDLASTGFEPQTKKGIPKKIETAEKTTYTSPPKKARNRKYTVDSFDVMDKVLMRQPPKKRTKEIREMMKNESSTTDQEQNIASRTSLARLAKTEGKDTSVKNVKKTRKYKESQPSTQVHMCHPQLIAEKVAELDMTAPKAINLKIYRCCFCDRAFLIAKRALVHIISTHEISLEECINYVNIEDKNAPTKDAQVCDICDYKTKKSGMYYVHFHKYFRHNVPLPKGWEPYRCDLCKKEFFTKFQLREHKLIHFDDHPFICETCGSKFKTRTAWNSHTFHKHNTEKRFKCPECPKSFKTMTKLKVHTRVHSGVKPFLCPKQGCIYRSTTRGNMKLHLTSKHKLQAGVVMSLMEALKPSEPEEGEEIAGEPDSDPDPNTSEIPGSNIQRKSKSLADTEGPTLPLEILVFSEGNDPHANSEMVAGNRADIPVSSFQQMDVSQQNKMMNDASIRELSQFNTGMQVNTAGDSSIERNVSLIIQDMARYMSQSDYAELRKHNEELSMSSARIESLKYSKAVTEPHKIIDPNSREARMFLKEALEHPEHRQLLKNAIYNSGGHFEDSTNVDQQSHPDTAVLHQSQVPFQESDNLVIDMQADSPEPSESQNIQNTISTTLQRLRNSYQYREAGGGAQLASEPNVAEMLHSITAQGQVQDMTVQGENLTVHGHGQVLGGNSLQEYSQRPTSPPAYSHTSHSLVAMARQETDLVPCADVPIDCVSQQGGQGHVQGDQQILPGAVFSGIAPQATATGQFNSDGNLYEGYYQEQYDIENY